MSKAKQIVNEASRSIGESWTSVNEFIRFHNFKTQSEFIGKLVEKTKLDIQGEEKELYIFEDENGTKVYINPCHAITSAVEKYGKKDASDHTVWYRFIFKENKKLKGGKSFKDFDVFVKTDIL